MKVGFAGSFDPITNGHEYVIREALNLGHEVIVYVANNPSKKYMFSGPERVKMIEDMCLKKGWDNRVKAVLIGNEYVASAAKRDYITYFIRGVRNSVDFDYENTIQHANAEILSGPKTFFIMPPRDLSSVSSSFVRSMIGPVHWERIIPSFVHPVVSYEIKKRFIENVCAGLGGPGAMVTSKSYSLADLIVCSYSKPHRFYHNLDHVIHCMGELDDYISHNDYPGGQAIIIRSALLMHDIVYDSSANNNESLSAQIAREWDGFWDIDTITRLIMSTKTHTPQSLDEEIMCDVDLAILGQPDNQYREYVDKIRMEYNHLDDTQFTTGRMTFLQSMLARDKIFHTDFFAEKYESQARFNIITELDSYQ